MLPTFFSLMFTLLNQTIFAGGTCWADTSCDTSLGDGALYNRDDPSHSRFCGLTYNEAMEACSVDTHCPTGDHAECPEGYACFSFLTGCNYVDMVGGPGNVTISSGNATKLDPDDPTRSNYCGVDWNDAISNCDNDDHWCASGADSDCPEGKTCFAGTECKYESDLFPTISPTSGIPTIAPSLYSDPANLRFCGVGWDEAQKTCRIASHCPSGEDTDCPEGQACFDSPSVACNIVDFKKYLTENGQEIFGADHAILTEDSIPGENLTSTASILPMPSSSVEPTPTVSVGLSATTVTSTTPDLSAAGTLLPSLEPTPSPFQTNSHVFCGVSWQDASDRCSPETFCSEGAALHKCPNPSEFCWVGITACDAGDWSAGGSVSPSGVDVISGTSVPSSFLTSSQTMESSFAVSSSVSSTSSQKEEDDSPVIPCNEDQPCPSGYICSSNIICTADAASEPFPTPIPVETMPPSSFTQLSNAPTSTATLNTDIYETSMPSSANQLSPPTISIILSEDEITQRLSNENNYCATSLSEVESSCSFDLQTCNVGDSMCSLGTFCFENILCTVSQGSTQASPMPASTSTSPTPVSTSSGTDEGSTTTTTTTAQKRCAPSLDQLLLTCDTAPTCSDSVCPEGMFCFSELICASVESSTIAPATIVPTNPSPSSIPTSLSSTTSLTTIPCDTDGNGNPSIPQNYCAKSREELQSSCSTAQTCNDNDAPCPSGSFCFPEVICECRQDTQTTLTFNFALPTKMPTPAFNLELNDQNIAAPAATSDPCNNLCLEPLDPVDCEYALSLPNIMPCTGFPSIVQLGDLCTGTGICGTNSERNTCSNSLDFYWRLEPYRCIESGLANGTGVITAESVAGGTSLSAGGMNPNPMFNFSQTSFSPPPSSTDSGVNGMPQNETFNFSKSNFSDHGQLNHGALKGSTEDSNSELTGWWLKESSSTRIGTWGWIHMSHLVLFVW